MTSDNQGSFQHRHIGPDTAERDRMLRTIGLTSLGALIDQTIPPGIRSDEPLDLPEADTEHGYLRRLARHRGAESSTARSYIGMGYYDCVTPSVILRNVFENPGWYTPYTPYQAEIAQGRLESLLNFQTVVKDLTGMDIATASLLDEGTAAAEAMTMFHRAAVEEGAGRAAERVPRVGPMLSADDRRSPRPRRTARHRARGRRSERSAEGAVRRRIRAPDPVPGRSRRSVGSCVR